jgi:hypothetical protein
MSLAKNIVWLAASAIPSFGLDSVCLGSDTLGGVELIPSVSVVCSSYPILEHAFAMSQAWQVDNYSVNCKALYPESSPHYIPEPLLAGLSSLHLQTDAPIPLYARAPIGRLVEPPLYAQPL